MYRQLYHVEHIPPPHLPGCAAQCIFDETLPQADSKRSQRFVSESPYLQSSSPVGVLLVCFAGGSAARFGDGSRVSGHTFQ